MRRIGQRREEIYDHFHASDSCQAYFFDTSNDADYAAYYTSMYLLQDTIEGVISHQGRGFSDDPLIAYIEFWGVMQGIIIQQDAIEELHRVLCGQELKHGELAYWGEIRSVRNMCAGHPVKTDRPKKSPVMRTFMGRQAMTYEDIEFETWVGPKEIRGSQPNKKEGGTVHSQFNLGNMIGRYAGDAD